MNAPSCITGILDEYCWMHTPGGWKCQVCWLEIRLTDFFADVATIARIVVFAKVQSYQDTYYLKIAYWLHEGLITVEESARMVDDLLLRKVLSGDTCPTPTTCQEFACMGHCERVAIGESEVHHAS